MKKYLFALLSIGTIFYACSKDDDKKSDENNTKMQLITSATWKYDTAAIADDNGKPVSALPPGSIDACQKDNTITFKSDSTGTLNEGALMCSGSSQNTSFKWWFKDNGNTLYSPDPIFGGFNGDVKVIELTATKLRVTKQVTIAPFPTANIMIDLKH
ncbi:hypothetical protein A4H97_06120 [Niastella yeongjuensis]|uniref:Lipocalin-like domain-containing protein n=1 Tax=Niastella yeongjuensis TaxID=354355 RepID=A0A1V9ELR3_9BACT|nr:lipocalin family protein [Niastella yeongjuensis]OQP47088.1 hypothetical protein A4H97_06120 [Niastella yeongjuensis]